MFYELLTLMTVHGSLRRVNYSEWQRARKGGDPLIRTYKDGATGLLHVNNILPRVLLPEKQQALVDR